MIQRSIKEQAKSGTRKGLMWVFGIGWGSLVVAGIGLLTKSTKPSPILGWILLIIATVILVLTMDRWKKIIAGLLAYGAVNCFVSIFSGHVTSNSSVHISKVQAIIATIFLITSTALCIRFMDQEL